MTKFIAYYRVSTKQQGQSGLGLEGQQAAVERHCHSGDVIAEFTEVESGSKSDRPELAKALAAAKREGATLVVAKLDRLSRNVRFTSDLLDSGVDFVACDNPSANRMTIQLLAVFAEQELRSTSERTKAGLAAAKARGVKLGGARPGHWEKRRENAKGKPKQYKPRPSKYTPQLLAQMKQLRGMGYSYRAVAEMSSELGPVTSTVKPFRKKDVLNEIKR